MTVHHDGLADAADAADAAGLRYSTDRRPGITRRRAGRGFSYRYPDGRLVRDPATRERIRALAIPPAWSDVWICSSRDGHLQAVGRDARGRKQYRYHPRWHAHRGADKFARMLAFAEALPRIRARCDADLKRAGLPRDKVLATVVRLLESTLIRVGNAEYVRLHRSFGLTTLRDSHASTGGGRIRFRFRAKSGRMREVELHDRRLAAIVRRCQDLPGQELFQYLDDDGEVRDVSSDDVNAYLRAAAGGGFTAKDFRTWAGTVLAYRALAALQAGDDERARRRNVAEAMRIIADRLGNSPAIARQSYVHPAVLDAYLDGSLGSALVEAAELRAAPPGAASWREERAVKRLLRQRLRDGARTRRSRRRIQNGR